MSFEDRPPPVTRGAGVDRRKRALARAFRKHATESERTAWELLRARRCLGLKFRRQQVIRGFIVDFYCAELGLALEIDGGVHADTAQAAYDDFRDLTVWVEAGILVLPHRHA